MAANIQFLRSTVPHLRPYPNDLSLGTPMVNVNDNDPGLYFRSSGGNLLKVGPVHVGADPSNLLPPGGANTSLCVGEQWLDTSNTERPRLLTWDGGVWRETKSVDNLVYVQESAPTGLEVVDSTFWFKPSTRELFLRENNTWIDIQRAPYGNQGEVQYNNGDEFHASPNFKYDGPLNQLSLGSILFPDGEIFNGSAGNNTEIQFKQNGEFGSSAEFTYEPVGKIFTVLGNTVLGDPTALPAHTTTLNGAITLNGDTEVSGAFTAKSTLTFEGDTVIGTDSSSTLEVHSTSIFNNNVTVGDNVADIFTSVGVARLNSRVEIGLNDTTELVVNSRSFIKAECELGVNATLSQWYIEKLSNSEITSPQIGDVLVHGPGNKWYNEAPGAGPYGNMVEEAPMDGQKYVRQNGSWVVA